MDSRDDKIEITIPVLMLHNEDAEARAHGIQRMYLTEIKRQSEYALRGFDDALRSVSPADPQRQETWYALQAALTATAIVARILRTDREIRGGQAKRRAAAERAERLRQLLGIPDDDDVAIFAKGVRDSVEHFDERLDDIALDPTRYAILDQWLTIGPRPVLYTDDTCAERIPALREFAPAAGFVMCLGDQVDIVVVCDTLRMLVEKCDELLAKPEPSSATAVGWFMRFEDHWVRHDDPRNTVHVTPPTGAPDP